MTSAAFARRIAAVGVLGLGLAAGPGCAPRPGLPAPVSVRPLNGETKLTFDVDGDGHADYWQFRGPDGRVRALAYADDPTGPGPRIELDEIPASACPHFIIALDGVPFEVVADMYRDGHFRLFHPPAKLICGYPSMTDLALAEMFHVGPCVGFEALYFDRQANRLSDGSAVYLSGRNSPWLPQMDYRCSLWWDVKVYLDPQAVFDHELRGIADTLSGVESGRACAYSVGTAGLGTRGGRPAIEKYLEAIDRLCEQIVYERRGQVKITLTADHGHNLVPCRRVSFDDTLKAAGYRPASSLRDPQDVVTISYGLVTYAGLHTRDPAGVAACLVKHPDVEFVCHPADDTIIVMDQVGRARVRRTATGFAYDVQTGDPLKLAAIIAELHGAGKVAEDGSIDDAALFVATVEHEYPDPLRRLWEAFHRQALNPPDVIANLRDGACHGSRFFYAMVGTVASTHGSLNRMNSTAFALTMLGELPPALRTKDLLPALEAAEQRPPGSPPQK
ncbi:MAG: hypothetical protein AB1601_07195 [Planctomycetota bacterium]